MADEAVAIIERAVQILSPATRARLEGLDQIERLKADIALLQDGLRKETQAAQSLKKKYETLTEQFQRDKDEWLAKTVKKAEKKVEEAIQHAKADDDGGWTQAAKDMVFGTKRRQGMIEAFAKSAVRNAAGQLGRSLLRGVLGSLKR